MHQGPFADLGGISQMRLGLAQGLAGRRYESPDYYQRNVLGLDRGSLNVALPVSRSLGYDQYYNPGYATGRHDNMGKRADSRCAGVD